MWKFFVLCKTYLTQIMLLLERKVHFLLGLVPKVLAAREKTVRQTINPEICFPLAINCNLVIILEQ